MVDWTQLVVIIPYYYFWWVDKVIDCCSDSLFLVIYVGC